MSTQPLGIRVPMSRLLHPTAEAAELIGVGRSTLYELIKSGDIETVKIGRRTLIHHDELERYVRSLTSSPEPAA